MFVPMMATVGDVITVLAVDATGKVGLLVDAEPIAKVTPNAIVTAANTILLATTLAGPDVLVEVEPY